jgi:diguanylate cyclase (GGDEF)-like protein
VLLVDDDESTAILVRSHLGKLKPTRYVLEWRGTASDGLAALMTEHWDACLLDYHIGDESGFDVLRTALQRNVATPIIMFTSGAGTDVDLATVRAGAADYLLKTELSPSLLSRTIRYAIERSRLLNEMRSLARHDHLTGLLTRREMDRVLDEELIRSHRYGHPVALILIDLDHFKQINDTYGHVSGDAALRGVAAVVQQCARDTDRAARYGGDELAVLLPETDHVGACVLAERIRARVAASGIEPPPDAQVATGPIPLTLSVGVAALPGATVATPSEFIARADAALYQAKRSGRNQVVCAD